MEPSWSQSYVIPKGWHWWQIPMLCQSRQDHLGWKSVENYPRDSSSSKGSTAIYSKITSRVWVAEVAYFWSWPPFLPKAGIGESMKHEIQNAPSSLMCQRFLNQQRWLQHRVGTRMNYSFIWNVFTESLLWPDRLCLQMQIRQHDWLSGVSVIMRGKDNK